MTQHELRFPHLGAALEPGAAKGRFASDCACIEVEPGVHAPDRISRSWLPVPEAEAAEAVAPRIGVDVRRHPVEEHELLGHVRRDVRLDHLEHALARLAAGGIDVAETDHGGDGRLAEEAIVELDLPAIELAREALEGRKGPAQVLLFDSLGDLG